MHDVAIQERPAVFLERGLLREYVQSGSQRAFGELVDRYSGLVYSAALRQVRDRHLAEDVTQSVFLLLAQKARSLGDDVVIAGWLYNAARFVSGNVIKKEARRRIHEPTASAMRVSQNHDDESTFREVLPLLDDALADMSQLDRDALILRYFDRKSVAQIADVMAIKTDAAEKRVARALDKLRGLLARRGVVAAAVPLATLLETESVRAAPAQLVEAVQAGRFSSTIAAATAGSGKAAWLTSHKTVLALITFALLTATAAAVFVHTNSPAANPQAIATSSASSALSIREGLALQLVRIPAGGAVLNPFLMGKFEVTQAQWSAVMPSNPSGFRGDDRPVERVTWEESRTFCEKLSAITGYKVRLPTEEEWEHACRAGTATRYYFGDDPSVLSQHAWHDVQQPRPRFQPGAFTAGGSGRTTHAVGSKLPNPWGLHDMYGNVWEWCDSIAPQQRSGAQVTTTASTNWMNVRRGGSFANSTPREFQSNYRWLSAEGLRQDNVGFRVVVEDR